MLNIFKKLCTKKVLIQFALYFFFFIYGMIVYKNDYFPINQFRAFRDTITNIKNPPIIRLVDYHPGMFLFSDRKYFDTIKDTSLKAEYVILIPRHHKKNISIKTNQDILIYRTIAKGNKNSIFNNWLRTDININVEGISINHTKVVKKIFKKGEIILESGGPISSSIILLKRLNQNSKLTLKIFNQDSFLEKLLKKVI